jgi:hypothetical protein
MCPAGALFPWDVSGDSIVLTWKAGVDAFLWRELVSCRELQTSGTPRVPWHFDWPRFRELIGNGNIPEAVRQDLWLADWKEISRKTVLSGFDRRRIVSRSFTEISVPGLEGLWAGTSPFAPLVEAPDGGPLRVMASDTPDTWVSEEGIVRCSKAGWVIIR